MERICSWLSWITAGSSRYRKASISFVALLRRRNNTPGSCAKDLVLSLTARDAEALRRILAILFRSVRTEMPSSRADAVLFP